MAFSDREPYRNHQLPAGPRALEHPPPVSPTTDSLLPLAAVGRKPIKISFSAAEGSKTANGTLATTNGSNTPSKSLWAPISELDRLASKDVSGSSKQPSNRLVKGPGVFERANRANLEAGRASSSGSNGHHLERYTYPTPDTPSHLSAVSPSYIGSSSHDSFATTATATVTSRPPPPNDPYPRHTPPPPPDEQYPQPPPPPDGPPPPAPPPPPSTEPPPLPPPSPDSSTIPQVTILPPSPPSSSPDDTNTRAPSPPPPPPPPIESIKLPPSWKVTYDPVIDRSSTRKGKEVVRRVAGKVLDGEPELVVRDPRDKAREGRGSRKLRPVLYLFPEYKYDANSPGPPPPPPPRAILITSLSHLTPTAQIRQHFSSFGRIEDFLPQNDASTGAPLGICWIKYDGDDSSESGRGQLAAKEACRKVNGQRVGLNQDAQAVKVVMDGQGTKCKKVVKEECEKRREARRKAKTPMLALPPGAPTASRSLSTPGRTPTSGMTTAVVGTGVASAATTPIVTLTATPMTAGTTSDRPNPLTSTSTSTSIPIPPNSSQLRYPLPPRPPIIDPTIISSPSSSSSHSHPNPHSHNNPHNNTYPPRTSSKLKPNSNPAPSWRDARTPTYDRNGNSNDYDYDYSRSPGRDGSRSRSRSPSPIHHHRTYNPYRNSRGGSGGRAYTHRPLPTSGPSTSALASNAGSSWTPEDEAERHQTVQNELARNGYDHVEIARSSLPRSARINEAELRAYFTGGGFPPEKVLYDAIGWYITFNSPPSARRAVMVLETQTIAHHKIILTAYPAPPLSNAKSLASSSSSTFASLTHHPLRELTEDDIVAEARRIILDEIKDVFVRDLRDRVLSRQVREAIAGFKPRAKTPPPPPSIPHVVEMEEDARDGDEVVKPPTVFKFKKKPGAMPIAKKRSLKDLEDEAERELKEMRTPAPAPTPIPLVLDHVVDEPDLGGGVDKVPEVSNPDSDVPAPPPPKKRKKTKPATVVEPERDIESEDENKSTEDILRAAKHKRRPEELEGKERKKRKTNTKSKTKKDEAVVAVKEEAVVVPLVDPVTTVDIVMSDVDQEEEEELLLRREPTPLPPPRLPSPSPPPPPPPPPKPKPKPVMKPTPKPKSPPPIRSPTPDPTELELVDPADEEELYFLRQGLALRKAGLPLYTPAPATPVPPVEIDGPDPLRPTLKLPVNVSGSARTEGYYKIPEAVKSLYLPQRNKAVVDTADASTSHLSTAPVQAVATSRSNRVNSRKLVQGMEQANKYITQLGASDASDNTLKLKFNQLRARKKQLKFSRSPIHDWGLYAMEYIPAGEMVIEYVGEVIRAQVADKREKYYERTGIGSSYLFRVDDDSVVDATKKGNLGRLINHCCAPNCTAKIITINGEKKIVIYAKTNIEPGEEITYDYHFPIEQEKIICLCGSPKCRGFLN